MKRHHRARARAAGFTLLEMSIATTIFGIAGYGLLQTVRVADQSHESVLESADGTRALREASATILDELRAARAADLSVTTMPDGNSDVRFTTPIEAAGVATWGVHDARLGASEEEQNREGWLLRYAVEAVQQASGNTVRVLVRQVLDDTGAVQRQDIFLGDLSGTSEIERFVMRPTGDVWEIELAAKDEGSPHHERTATFNLRIRN